MSKNQVQLLLVGFIITMHLNCSKTIEAPDCTGYPIPQDAYVYPITPGTSAWLALGSTDDRVKACQIPASILSGMSTFALIQSWLDFPFNTDVFLSSNLQSGMQFWLSNFSGLIELQNRVDAGKKILERYISMNPECIVNFTTAFEKGKFSAEFVYLQLLLSQDVILNNLVEKDKKVAVSVALKNYYTENKFDKEYYTQLDFGSCIFTCARIMRNANYPPFATALNGSSVLKEFLATGRFPNGIIESDADMRNLIRLSSDYSK